MNRIRLRSGTEGPHYDPWSYDEVTVSGRNGNVTYHAGLAEWTKHDGVRYDEVEARPAFERLTGVTPEVAIRARIRKFERKLRAHWHECRGEIEDVDGFPGETLTICRKCGTILGSSFNESAII